ncbi:MAG TPA: hypothetical protein PKE37_04805 [Thiomonas arsenitoxydans]|uniref:hypothetical protein n=1 Tax=Thiomonas TaxID=32012 RepID=UPI00257B70D7|nr:MULTISPECIES: hypothetical protein [Thiomonas]HML81073.1 hypothetical protein [Thiomonas arsenitoxydans]
MKRSVLLAVLLCAGVLAGCGKSSPITAASTAAGPSPFSGRDEAWFMAYPKENETENVWCKTNIGYLNPTVKEQAKTYDPACDVAASAYYKRMMNAKTQPGAF